MGNSVTRDVTRAAESGVAAVANAVLPGISGILRTATKSSPKPKHPSLPDLGVIPPTPHGIQQNDPAPIYRPYTSIGKPGRPGSTLYRGYMEPASDGKPNGYRFIFHYNPPNFQFNMQAGKLPPLLSNDQTIDPAAAASAVSLSFLINRQEEVASRTPTKNRVANLQNFGDLGTMYDVEYMLRVFNGDPVAGTDTAYNQYLMMQLVYVYFSPTVHFHGFVTDLTVNHAMFDVYMIPTISEVQISLTGIIGNGQASADSSRSPMSQATLAPGTNGVKFE